MGRWTPLRRRRRGGDCARRGLAFALAATVLALTGCAPADDAGASSPVQLDVALAPAPPRVGEATLTLTLAMDGRPVEGAALSIEGNMAHAGMVPVFAEASETAPGTYLAQLEFTMGGDWFLLVFAELPDGSEHGWKHDVPGVLPE